MKFNENHEKAKKFLRNSIHEVPKFRAGQFIKREYILFSFLLYLQSTRSFSNQETNIRAGQSSEKKLYQKHSSKIEFHFVGE